MSNESVEFSGAKQHIRLDKVTSISYGRQGIDFANKWVKIEFPGGSAFLADGRWLGWRGIFGGTWGILGALRQVEHGSYETLHRTAATPSGCGCRIRRRRPEFSGGGR